MKTRLKVCGIISVEEAGLRSLPDVHPPYHVGPVKYILTFISAMPSGSGIIPESLIAEITMITPPISRFY